jgi:hypothetical protein
MMRLSRRLPPIAAACAFLVLGLSEGTPAAATCQFPKPIAPCTDDAQKPGACTGSCGTYTACPCDRVCQDDPAGTMINCAYDIVTRPQRVYQNGFPNLVGCCSGGIYVGPSSTVTCAYQIMTDAQPCLDGFH